MPDRPDHLAVLAAYVAVIRPTGIQVLGGAGGFSGARFWRVETEAGAFCLRRWPADYPGPAELEFIHAVLRHARQRGFRLVPLPLENGQGRTHVSHGGHLWEVSAWMPGKADFSVLPTEMRLRAATTCLAEFHRAVEDFSSHGPTAGGGMLPRAGPSPGIAQRLALLREWLSGRAGLLEEALARPLAWPEMVQRVERLLRLLPQTAPTVYGQLAQVQTHRAPLQPCLGDVWHDHVLYEGERVSGLVDFGSMRWDNVSCDLARLLGSLAGNDQQLWAAGLSAYEAVRPLSQTERDLIQAFDRSSHLLGALNWANWVVLEGRIFEEPTEVLKRIDDLMARLEKLQFEIPSARGLVL